MPFSTGSSAVSGCVVIRPARADDDQALQRIDVVTCTEDVSPAPPPQPGSDFFSDDVKPENVLVAEHGGAVVGYVKVRWRYPFPSGGHVTEITGLAVAPEAQGGGVGRRLVTEAVELVRSKGARRLTLRVLATNAVARRLYARSGFVVEGVHHGEFRLREQYVDDVLLALELNRTGDGGRLPH